MPQTAARLPSIRKPQEPPTRPEWVQIVDKFYKESFHAPNTRSLAEAANAFADLHPGEQAFHSAHLAYRQVQALADVHAAIEGLQVTLTALDKKGLALVKHVRGARKALAVIARNQKPMLAALEAVQPDDPDDDDEIEADGENSDGDDSELSDAIADDVIEEEDHGHGDALVPEVLPAGTRRFPEMDGGAS